MLRATLKDFDPKNTIVHLHGWSKALSSSVVHECVERSFKVVCTLHDYFVACLNGGFYNFRTNNICYLHALSLPCVLENCDSRSYNQTIWRVARQIVQRQFGGIPGGISAFISVSNFSKGCGDASSLGAAMKRLMVSQVAQNMGRNAYEQYWRDPPTISDHVLRLEKAYLDTLAGASV